jgi:predicted transglutaminase-like cysteine proteinase
MELMETEEALQIVNVLMKGVNPDTASTLPNRSPYNSPRVLRALFTLVNLVNQQANKEALFENVGKSWGKEDDIELTRLFEMHGEDFDAIAKKLKRTNKGIAFRLQTINLISEAQNPYIERSA